MFCYHKTQKLGENLRESEIQREKFKVLVTYIFEAKFGRRHEFQRQILGPSPPRPDMDVPPGHAGYHAVDYPELHTLNTLS